MAVLRPAPHGANRNDRLRRIRLPLVLFVLAFGGLPVRRIHAQTSAGEYQVKAAYLLNFARFVEWPADVLPATSPMGIVIVGNDPFGPALTDVLRGKLVNGHPILLRHLRWNDDLTSSNIVFIGASEESHLPEILHNLGHHSVLTVSDMDRFSLRGGVIELVMVGNRVRFDIDRESAIAARLSVSSKLLSVARAIHERGTAQ